ncbi:MAG: hypothetical protein R6X25_01100 [Candidatus Krumholzibacteriia bacterium]
MSIHTWQMVQGHPIVTIDGVRALVDTGSPSSFGNRERLTVAGTVHQLQRNQLGLSVDAIAAMAGIEFDVLLGTDVLRQTPFHIRRTGRLEFGAAGPADPSLSRIDLAECMGVPVATADVAGRPVRVVVDTGAQLGYLPPDVIAPYPVVDEVEDFYPAFGKFETEVREVPLTLGAQEYVLRFGSLPTMLALALGLMGAEGIVGSELLALRDWWFDLGGKEDAETGSIRAGMGLLAEV